MTVDGPSDRARGALLGLAIGDALGMPTQGLPFDLVRRRYGLLTGFEPAPDDNPISWGMAAGLVTDDTAQAVIVGRLLAAGDGRLEPLELARELLAWEARMRAAGSLDLLGPSTRRALARVAEGVPPDRSGAGGDTNGASMRVAPVGICCPVVDETALPALVERVAEVSRVTHNTAVAIAGASAVAAVVSAGIAGVGRAPALDLAIGAARLGAAYGADGAATDLAGRARWAIDLVAGRPVAEALELVSRVVGAGVATLESVPAALALTSLLPPGDPWLVVRAAASLGDDSDTVAAMAGAMCGALSGAAAFPEAARAELARANPELDLDALADALVAVRRAQ